MQRHVCLICLALTANGDLWSVLDNDGGAFEPRLVRIGSLDDE